MDGADGLAGGMALAGFGAYAIAASQAGLPAIAALSAAVAAASAAFLLFNFAPARIFMGDVGSVPLGFLAGALGILGWRAGGWPLWFPMLVFAPFACDATLTLLKRALRRERLSQAHREHYYQRLVRMGFGHRGTAWIEYAAMAGCAGLALLARVAEPGTQIAAVAAAAAALAGVAVWIDVRWARHRRHSDGAPA
jgi:UDP-N-acetylmuramyl pentapeptide phosphotransferase/UDP-N-acetylglucosamine-1-phosphate transferase